MRQIMALIGVLAIGVLAAHAEEHGKPGAGEHEARYMLIDHAGKEHKFDLSDPKQRFEMLKMIEDGDAEEVKKDEKLDLFGIKRWDLGIWSVIIFLVLFAVLSKFAWGPMIKGLKTREENIRGALDQAEKTRREAMELQNKLDAKMRDAGAEIAAKMDEAHRNASAVKDQMVAEAKAQIQQDRDRLLREIEAAKTAALQEIWQQSVALATMISTKVVRRNMSEEDHRRLLDESLAELKQGGIRHA
jgi:F-type H+-transporting ATPase subunit b